MPGVARKIKKNLEFKRRKKFDFKKSNFLTYVNPGYPWVPSKEYLYDKEYIFL